jgi:hypothetical protein
MGRIWQNRVMAGAEVVLFLLSIAPLPRARADEPAAAAPVWLTVRAVHPEVQADRLIALFQGARAPHPAAALAAWKHATGGRQSLGKPLEAAVAALNPAMAGELRLFDRAELRLTVDATSGHIRWQALAPGDDGSLAALTTALALTDGAPLEPLGATPVVRLGPPGSALAATRPGLFAVAASRAELSALLDPKTATATGPAMPRLPHGDRSSGWSLVLDPARLRRLESLDAHRASDVLDELRCRGVEGWAEIADETLTLQFVGRLDAAPPVPATIDPAWLDPVPATGVAAVAAVALGRGGEGLDTAFRLADRFEKADPGRAQVAPLRIRLNLLAAAARVRPDVDFWPVLQGVTGAVLVDVNHHLRGALVGLHANDAEAAGRIARDVVPRLAASYLRAKRTEPPAAFGPGRLGAVGGRPVEIVVIGSTVWLGWGDRVLDDARAAAAHPDRSAGPAVRAAWGKESPQRGGAFWPGRWERLAPPGSPLARALADAPPVVWLGGSRGATLVDAMRWSGLRGIVRRWLDALPLDPPPDRSVPPARPRPAGEPPR